MGGVAGGVGGLYQTSVGGVLGYSAVLNSGYLLLLVTTGADPLPLFVYLGVYSVGAALVGVVAAVGVGQLGYRAVPAVGWGLALYYLALNLGGLPVYPGFASKLFILWAFVAPTGGLVLAGVVVLFSVFGVVYYLEVASNFVVDPGPAGEATPGWTPFGVALAGGFALAGAEVFALVGV